MRALQVDTLVLGTVKSIFKFHLTLCLPYGQTGRVNVYDISDTYTDLLQDVVASGEPNDAVTDLNSMFRVGQFVRGCVVKSEQSGQNLLHYISLNPKFVNKGFLKRYIRSFTTIVGAVESEEDHGYSIYSGIPGLKCFLSRDDHPDTLPMGTLVTVKPFVDDSFDFATLISSRVLRVTIQEHCSDTLTADSAVPVHFDSFLPGVRLRVKIQKRVKTTIVGKYYDHTVAINHSHIPGNLDDYPINSEVVTCLILVDPGTKQLMGSLLPHLISEESCFPSFPTALHLPPVGTRLEKAVISRVDKHSVHLVVTRLNDLRAVLHKSRLPSKLAKTDLKSKFARGGKLTCRVFEHDLFQNVAVCTMQKKLMELPFLSMNELSLGDKLTAVVNRFSQTGIVVRVEDRFNGLIPFIHLTDVPIKNPSERFTRGEKLLCCVISIDKHSEKLLLTAKPGLINSTYPLFGSNQMQTWLDQPSPREPTLFTVFIYRINERGLWLAGLGDKRAWLPKGETGLGSDNVLEATYFRGQVLKVRIVHDMKQSIDKEAAPSGQRFLVSLKIKGGTTTHKREHKTKSSSVQVGQVFQAKVTKVQSTGLSVDLHTLESDQSTGSSGNLSATVASAFLKFDQLSDSETNQSLFSQCMDNVKSGSLLDWDQPPRSVVIIACASNNVIVSARPSLIAAAAVALNDQTSSLSNEQSGAVDLRIGFVREFSDLRVGTQWFGWVANHVDYGIFVQFPVGIRGLAPVRLLSDTRVPKHVQLIDIFPIGSTVIAKVVELAPSEKRRCLVSLRMLDTYHAEEHYVNMAIRSLSSQLTELRWIASRNETLSGFRIGDLINFHVDATDTQLVVGRASKTHSRKKSGNKTSEFPAFAYIANTDGIERCTTDSILPGVVSYVDYSAGRLEIVLANWLVHAIQNRKENAASSIQIGQELSSVTIAFRPRDMAVVAFRGHAAGRFGLIPARRTFNDITGGNAWAISQRNQVTVRECSDAGRNAPPFYLCTLVIHNPVNTADVSLKSKKNRSFVNAVGELGDSETKVNLNSLDLISGLRWQRIVGHVAFLRLPHPSNQLVFCHLINLAPTVRELRAFQLHPLNIDSVIDMTATVIHTAAEDKLLATNRAGLLKSKLPEVSFLDKHLVEVDDSVSALIIHKRQDNWILELPGDTKGYLHLTNMSHCKVAKPISLKPGSSNAQSIINTPQLPRHFDAKKLQFISCRIIDRLDTADGTEPIFQVCTKPEVLRGSSDTWAKFQPKIGEICYGFVSIRSPNGLLLSITHKDELFIPFVESLGERLKAAMIRFRTHDQVCVRPTRYFKGHLFGELVFENEPPSSEEESANSLDQAMVDLIQDVTAKRSILKKREVVMATRKKSGDLVFIDNPTTQPSEQSPSKSKRKRTTSDSVLSDAPSQLGKNTKRKHSEFDTLQSCASKIQRTDAADGNSWDITDPEFIEAYADFMLPDNFDAANPSEDPVPQSKPLQSSVLNVDKQIKEDVVTTEWRTRQAEIRIAMLAALTSEQQALPKDHLRPTTTEEFELAVRNAPTNAAYWTAYMTHVLSGSNHNSSLVAARAIAERGLRAISNAAGLASGEQDLQQARLLSFLLIMEAKELDRCNQQTKILTTSGTIVSDPILAADEQATRLSHVLARLVNLDQTTFVRRAINTLVDIGQFERAEDLARRLIKSSPGDLERWLSLIKARFRAGRVDAAREAQRNATCILRAVHLPRFLSSSARLEFEFGDADRAISLFYEQLAAHPKQRLIYEDFIKVLLLSGKTKEAKQIKQKAADKLKANDCAMLDALFQSKSTSVVAV